MGMSASQMRYCMLSGKKSDVEFQGQQINQQRTTLATETSAYNNQLLNLTVPTPPSSENYSRTTYSFTSGAGEVCTITGVQYNSGAVPTAGGTQPGRWTVNYTTTSVGDEGRIYAMPTVMNANGNYTIGGNVLTLVDLDSLVNGGAVATQEDTADYAALLKICQDTGILRNPPPANTAITDPTPAQVNGQFYKYTNDGITKYILASSITDIPAGGSEANYTYIVDTDSTITNSRQLNDARIYFSESGRMTAVETTDNEGNAITYTLSVKNQNDDAAYNSAMQEYEYQKGLYDKQIENINSKIAMIEAQDKKLELKLQDLDTQQKALSTELDSVKKVIDKNIDQTFKAFA